MVRVVVALLLLAQCLQTVAGNKEPQLGKAAFESENGVVAPMLAARTVIPCSCTGCGKPIATQTWGEDPGRDDHKFFHDQCQTRCEQNPACEAATYQGSGVFQHNAVCALYSKETLSPGGVVATINPREGVSYNGPLFYKPHYMMCWIKKGATVRIAPLPPAAPWWGKLPDVHCYVTPFEKTKAPQPGNFKDLTLVSIVMGKLFDTFHDYPELRQNRIDYAKKHGYNYCEMRSAAAPPHTDRSANWNKFPLIMRLLKNYEYVMYLDADIIIGNLCKSLKPLIAHMGNAEMILSEDLPGAGSTKLNTGMLLFKNGAFSTKLLNSLVKRDKYALGLRKIWPFEQGAFVNAAAAHPEQFCLPDKTYFPGIATVDKSCGHPPPGPAQEGFAPWGPGCKAVVHPLGMHFMTFFCHWKTGSMFIHLTGPSVNQGQKYIQMAKLVKTSAQICADHPKPGQLHCSDKHCQI